MLSDIIQHYDRLAQERDRYRAKNTYYYDLLFKMGWDYGYVFPAMSKVIQASGRVIRSENDYGVVVLIDERFTWDNYFRCLPKDWKFIVTLTPEERIKRFLDEKENIKK